MYASGVFFFPWGFAVEFFVNELFAVENSHALTHLFIYVFFVLPTGK